MKEVVKGESAMSDGLLYLIAGILVLVGISKWLAPKIQLFMKWYHHHFFLTWIAVGIVSTILLGFIYYFVSQKLKVKNYEKSITTKTTDSVYVGRTDTGEAVHIQEKYRLMHTQVIGTTNAGKTESVIIPWAVQDMRRGSGLMLVDGKADRSLIDKLFAYTKKIGRDGDFKSFSLSDVNSSNTFNPLIGGDVDEITERVFNSFEFENAHYRSVQFEVFSQVMRIFESAKLVPTFLRLHQAIKDPVRLVGLACQGENESLIQWANYYKALTPNERENRTSGLTAAISHFAFGKAAKLFNTENPEIKIDEVLRKNKVVYFQLPVMLNPFLGRATGKMVLQCAQSAVSGRHKLGSRQHKFFTIFLDDFSEYLYPGFVTLLNKSRSARVAVVFAHQALGDLHALGDAVSNSILTNSNLKIIMRGNDPTSAEYFSKLIGTKEGTKITEKQSKNQKTGDGTIREVEEFVHHPNVIKQSLGVGQALVVLPHDRGSKVVKLKFYKLPDLEPQALPERGSPLPEPLGLPPVALAQTNTETTEAVQHLDGSQDQAS